MIKYSLHGDRDTIFLCGNIMISSKNMKEEMSSLEKLMQELTF